MVQGKLLQRLTGAYEASSQMLATVTTAAYGFSARNK